MKERSFIRRMTDTLFLRKFSLEKQLIIIFSTLILIVVVFLMPYIERNLSNLVDREMYLMLRYSQSMFIVYGEEYETSIDVRQLYHLKYHKDRGLVLNESSLSNEEAKDLVLNVFGEDLMEMILEGNTVVQSVANFQNSTLYYLIQQTDTNYYTISIANADYYNSLIRGIQNQVVNVIYIAILLFGTILYIWVLTLIKPLKSIRKYIHDIKEDKQPTLNINRKDEIGVVSHALVEMKEDLDNQNKIKEEMIHNISHDLKTPISLIKTYSESIKDGVYPYGDKESSMDVIIENAERLENKVYSLLYLNRLDYLINQGSDEEVNMKELIKHITSQITMIHPDIDIELSLENVIFKGDEEHWRICIENIIENAYRYVHKKIIITLKEGYLEIYNDGDLIDEEYLDSLFNPYEKGVKGQFGLGLSIVSKIVTMYEYTVKAKNRDIGVSFVIKKKY